MVEIRTPDQCVSLSPDECWRLYVLLVDGAPFVRNRLSVIRQGGTGAVSLSTPEERRQVLQVLAANSRGALSSGLRLLQTVLADKQVLGVGDRVRPASEQAPDYPALEGRKPGQGRNRQGGQT